MALTAAWESGRGDGGAALADVVFGMEMKNRCNTQSG